MVLIVKYFKLREKVTTKNMHLNR